ncbi:MAG: radical SAM superfamily enzyme YgiQ (UPF0313 family) [Myxococcota bacterium]
MRVQVCYVAMRENFGQIRSVMELCAALDIQALAYNRMSPTGRAIHHIARLLPTADEIEEDLDILEALGRRWGVSVGTAMPIPPCLVRIDRYSWIRFGFCSTGSASPNIVIDGKGDVRSCNLSSGILGNLVTDDWPVIYANPYPPHLQADAARHLPGLQLRAILPGRVQRERLRHLRLAHRTRPPRLARPKPRSPRRTARPRAAAPPAEAGRPQVSTDPAVLLISPGILKWTDMDFGLPHLVSMGGYVRQHTGVRVEILDLNYEGGDHNQLLATIRNLGELLLIGVSCYSSFDYMRVMALTRFLRDHFPDTPIITGGYHASALPDDVVFDGSPFDAVILGEDELPLREIVEGLLGGGRLEKTRYGPALINDLDTLPPYDWSLLNRYWPQANTLGRKFQIYLSRDCPYHCTFCMERSKSGYSWRAYSAERAVSELERLSKWTDLSRWIINLADPLFGFQRAWRREVLTGIIEKGLLPRQYWTLTRSDDLDEEDISLLARARCSIGIGLESGSPTMLRQMQKGNTPERYLGAVRRLARLSHDHGLTWAVNVIVGHPGETPETMAETAGFIRELFSMAPTTRGWLSVDPFRLYPGSAVAEQRPQWEATYGARFYAPEWWKSWYDLGFHAEHLDPGRELPFADRVNQMHATYGPIIPDISARFEGQGRDVDRVYRASIDGQLAAMSTTHRDATLALAAQAGGQSSRPELRIPLGMNLKDPWIRRREQAVRRLLDRGVLRSADLIEALLQVAPERFMGPDEAEAVLSSRIPEPLAEGLLPVSVDIQTLALGLEALEPEQGHTVADLTARSGYVAAVLSHLVGDRGRVIAAHPEPADPALAAQLAQLGNVTLIDRPQTAALAARARRPALDRRRPAPPAAKPLIEAATRRAGGRGARPPLPTPGPRRHQHRPR